MNWKITIHKVDNGYLISYPTQDSDGNEQVRQNVLEIPETPSGDKEAMTALLFRIAEHFGFHYQKYGDHNLRIAWDVEGHGKVDQADAIHIDDIYINPPQTD